MFLCLESNCQMRTLDSGIGTFPLPDAGSRSTGRYLCQADSPEDTEAILSLQPALCAAPSIRAQTLEREVPSSADSQGSAHTTIVHSTSDPIMVARGMQPLQSHLPKPASSLTAPRLVNNTQWILKKPSGTASLFILINLNRYLQLKTLRTLYSSGAL